MPNEVPMRNLGTKMGTMGTKWARQSQNFEWAPKQAPLLNSLHVNLHNVHEDLRSGFLAPSHQLMLNLFFLQ